MPRFAVVIRHGERHDDVNNLPGVGDTALSDNAERMFPSVAQKLEEALGKVVMEHLVMYCSPFLRCRQTAELLRKYGVGKYSPPTVIDNELCEVYGPVRIKCSEPPKPWSKGSLGTPPKWGETIHDARDRFVEAFARHVEESDESFCFAAHGDTVDAVYTGMFPTRQIYNIDYLGFICLELPKPSSAGPEAPRVISMHGCDYFDDGGGDDDKPKAIVGVRRRSPHNSAVQTHRIGGDRSAVDVDAPATTKTIGHVALTIDTRSREPIVTTNGGTPCGPYGELGSVMDPSPERRDPPLPTQVKLALAFYRLIGICGHFSLLAVQVPLPEVLKIVAAGFVVELLAHIPPIYQLCPSRPIRQATPRGSDDELTPLHPHPPHKYRMLRIPGVAGVLKYVVVIVVYIALSYITRSISDTQTGPTKLLEQLTTTAWGWIGCIALYVGSDAIRVIPEERRSPGGC